jgi:hypothetical protein
MAATHFSAAAAGFKIEHRDKKTDLPRVFLNAPSSAEWEEKNKFLPWLLQKSYAAYTARRPAFYRRRQKVSVFA